MTTLLNRSTPSQYRIYRAIAGAVRNTAHAHDLELPDHFPGSVAKRATGTLTSQWEEVVAAKAKRRQEGLRDTVATRNPRGFRSDRETSKGGRHTRPWRPPLLLVWKGISGQMWTIRDNPERRELCIKALRLIHEARLVLAEIEGLTRPRS